MENDPRRSQEINEKLRAVTSGEMPSAPENDRVDFVRRR